MDSQYHIIASTCVYYRIGVDDDDDDDDDELV